MDPMLARLPFLGGPPMVHLEANKLASSAEVVRRIYGWSGNISGSIRGPKNISSRLDNKRVAGCTKPGGCLDNNNPCLLYEVMRPGIDAKLPVMSAYRVLTKLEKLHTSYKDLRKHQDRFTEGEEEAKANELEKTFNIFMEGWRETIEEDNLITREKKEEKIQLLEDYLEDGGTR